VGTQRGREIFNYHGLEDRDIPVSERRFLQLGHKVNFLTSTICLPGTLLTSDESETPLYTSILDILTILLSIDPDRHATNCNSTRHFAPVMSRIRIHLLVGQRR